MKNVTVTFTGEQAKILLQMIRNDTESMKNAECEKRFIAQNERIENRLLKAIAQSNGGKPIGW